MVVRCAIPPLQKWIYRVGAPFLLGLGLAAALGIWWVPWAGSGQPAWLGYGLFGSFSLLCLTGCCVVSNGLRRLQGWIEYDGDAIRWKGLWTGRVGVRSRAEIVQVVVPASRWDRLIPVSQRRPVFVVRFSDGSELVVGGPDTHGAQQLVDAIRRGLAESN